MKLRHLRQRTPCNRASIRGVPQVLLWSTVSDKGTHGLSKPYVLQKTTTIKPTTITMVENTTIIPIYATV